MDFVFDLVPYEKLNARQQENYNFQKISAVPADFGFTTIRLSDDWNGADFLALHLSGETLKIQLKGRLSFHRKYCDKGIWICFPKAATGMSTRMTNFSRRHSRRPISQTPLPGKTAAATRSPHCRYK